MQTISETLWGVPADPGHDAERVCFGAGGQRTEGCASSAPAAPFLTLPGSCLAPLETTAFAESLEDSGILSGIRTTSVDAGGNPTNLIGCDQLPFAPTIAAQAETGTSDSPSGLSLDLRLPQTRGTEALATAALKDLAVELPEGFAIDPPVASGLAACSPDQIGLRSPAGETPVEFTAAAAECPEAARIGTVKLDSPLVDHRLSGDIYLATPYENPSGSLLAVYLAVDDTQSGVVLKLPAQVDTDSGSGRLTLRLEEAPQLPFEDLSVSLRGGPRAVFRTPLVCGAGRVGSRLTPWSAPDGRDVELTGSIPTTTAAGGGACPLAESRAPTTRASWLALSLRRLASSVPSCSRSFAPVAASAWPGSSDAARGSERQAGRYPLLLPGRNRLRDLPVAAEVGSVDIRAGAGTAPLQLGGPPTWRVHTRARR